MTDRPDLSARPYDEEGVRTAVRDLLVAVGEDPDRDGLRETPIAWPAPIARCLRASMRILSRS